MIELLERGWLLVDGMDGDVGGAVAIFDEEGGAAEEAENAKDTGHELHDPETFVGTGIGGIAVGGRHRGGDSTGR